MNILIKNMLDALIGALAYWSIGWGLAYGKGEYSELFISFSKQPSNITRKNLSKDMVNHPN